jgi:hypothetical protein
MPQTPDGSREELVKGVIVAVSPPSRFDHGFIQSNIVYLLRCRLARSPTGRVTTESGVVTEHDPDTVRGPDVACWSWERVPRDVPIEPIRRLRPTCASKSSPPTSATAAFNRS